MKGKPQPTITRRTRSAAFGKAAMQAPGQEIRLSGHHAALKDHRITLPRDYFSPFTCRQ